MPFYAVCYLNERLFLPPGGIRSIIGLGDKLIFPKGSLARLRNRMNNPFAYLIGALVIIMSLSLTQAIIQENSSIEENYNITLNNTTHGNMSLSSSSMEITNVGTTMPENIKSINNSSTNTSTNLPKNESKQSNGTIFTVGSGSMSNKSAHILDIPTLPAKNASYLWYIIQAKPHGYT